MQKNRAAHLSFLVRRRRFDQVCSAERPGIYDFDWTGSLIEHEPPSIQTPTWYEAQEEEFLPENQFTELLFVILNDLRMYSLHILSSIILETINGLNITNNHVKGVPEQSNMF